MAAPSGEGAAISPAAKPGAKAAAAAKTGFAASTKPGLRVAVLLVTGGGPAAGAEARQLAKLGAGTMVIDGSPTLSRLRSALHAVQRNARVDGRIGVIAEGEAAATAARLAATTPGLGAVVLSNPTAGVEQPLRRLRGSAHVMLQRGEDSTTMTEALAKRLVVAAPVGTLLHSFGKLGPASQLDRDRWVLAMLTT